MINDENTTLDNGTIEDIPVPTYHRTCKTLPLEAFIQAYCNNDLSGLLIAGTAIPEGLHEAWNEILLDYSGLLKTENSDYILHLGWEIARLNHHIIYVQYAIICLKYKYVEEFADELRSMGYYVPLFDEENYQSALELIISLAKSKVFELGNLEDEYTRLTKTVSGKKQTEDEFVRTVSMLSKYQGYCINTLTTTVYRFVMTFNNYLNEMSLRQKQLTSI